jgi:hypothetical protein
MNEVMEPEQLGLRRRRRAIPDEGPADDTDFDTDIDTGDDNEGAEQEGAVLPPLPLPTAGVRCIRHIPRGPATAAATAGPPAVRRRPPSDAGASTGSNSRRWRVSHLYCLASTILALLAIITASPIAVSLKGNRYINMEEQPQPQQSSTTSRGSSSGSSGSTITSQFTSTQWASTMEQVAKAAAVCWV